MNKEIEKTKKKRKMIKKFEYKLFHFKKVDCNKEIGKLRDYGWEIVYTIGCFTECYVVMKREKREKCVVCGKETPYLFSTPVYKRKHYSSISGQHCEDCDEGIDEE